MNFQYRKLVDDTRPEGHTFYPLVRIFLRQDMNMAHVLSLVDSGSADCVFPASLGELLHIDIPSGQPYQFHGFDNRLVPGFVHEVVLQVAGFTHWVPVDAVFLECEGMPILGQRGFFDNYQVVFEKWARRFEINTKETAMVRNRRGRGRAR